MPRPSLIPSILAGTLALSGAAYHWLLRRPRPQRQGAIAAKGLAQRVEVVRDRWAIPHLYADHDDDLFFAQGFVHAQERLWQMDFNRRAASGRLSEIAGPATLTLDRWMRTLGLRRSAEGCWPHTDGEAQRIALAYAAGVNAVIDAHAAANNWPFEFRLLGYTPERWTPVDTLTTIRLMAQGLSVNFEAELVRDGLARLLGPEGAEGLLPGYPPENPFVVPALSALHRFSPPGQGSNSWVVGPSRSSSGAPLLANDPHLMLRLPAIWFENHLEGPGYRVAGVSVPGIPGVIIGHNAEVAWGVTAGMADTQDLYEEERHPDDPTRFRWGEGFWLQAKQLEERIAVRGQAEAEPLTVTITRHGPLISPLLPEEPRDLALRWTIYEPDNTLGGLLALNRAENWGAVRAAAADIAVPQLNLSYADRAGNIGWIYMGRLPIRQDHIGLRPADGRQGEQEWLGYLGIDETPQLFNPPEGYIVHANNKPVGDDFPHWLGVDFYPGYRARRITDLLLARASHDLESFAAMQLDLLSIPALRVARALVAQPADRFPAALRPLRDLLATWDGRMTPGSAAATVAHTLMMRLRHLVVSGRTGSWSAALQGIPPRAAITGLPIQGTTMIAWLLEQMEQPEGPWWQLGDGANDLGGVLALALGQVAGELEGRFGPDWARWGWGQVNQLKIPHPLGAASPLLDRWLSRGPCPMPGDAFTLNPNTLRANVLHENESTAGASWRFLADLSDWDRCRTALPGGQSGHPGERHYAAALTEWRAGQTHPLLWSRTAVDRAAVFRLTLLP